MQNGRENPKIDADKTRVVAGRQSEPGEVMGRFKLRSDEWFERRDEVGIRHRSVLATLGFDPKFAAGKPIIGICNPSSELNNCEMGLKELAEPIKRGVAQAGGLALEFPTMG